MLVYMRTLPNTKTKKNIKSSHEHSGDNAYLKKSTVKHFYQMSKSKLSTFYSVNLTRRALVFEMSKPVEHFSMR